MLHFGDDQLHPLPQDKHEGACYRLVSKYLLSPIPDLGTGDHVQFMSLEPSGASRRPIQVRLGAPALRCAGLSLALLLAGCTAHSPIAAQNYEKDRANRLFAAGYQDVSDIYIEDVSIETLAIAGIENLTSIDPAIQIQRQGNQIAMSVDGRPAGSLSLPPRGDADSWADVTAETIKAGRQHSVQLANAGAEDVYEAVFDGIVGELDGFSRYAGREEARENRASRDGFGGIGVRISLIDEGVKVLSVMENTPAEQAGLLDGDVIVMIEGQPVVGLTQREVVRKLRGPLRSRVTLTVDRKGEQQRQVITVTRAHIVPQTVSYRREGEVGYIRVSGFNQSTAHSLRKKLEFAKDELGSRLKGIVLDLRNNPGGLLDQSVSVSDLFLGGGRIVSTHGRHPDSHQYFEASGSALAGQVPIVVLVNGSSASASEIVAAALQDAGRAVVIGSSSFGKGTVQTVLRLPNEGELTLTWARFHAPTGYALNRRGVLPDICTSNGAAGLNDVLEGLRSGRMPIERSKQTEDIAPNDEDGVTRIRSLCPGAEGENGLDLEIALELLNNPSLYAKAITDVPMTASTRDGQVSVSGGQVSAEKPL